MQRPDLNSASKVLVPKYESEQEAAPQSTIVQVDAHSCADSSEPNPTENAIGSSTRRLPSLRPNMGWKGKHLMQSENNAFSHGTRRRRSNRLFGGRREHQSGSWSNGYRRLDETSRRNTYYNQSPQPSNTAQTGRLPMPDWNNGSSELRQVIAAFFRRQQQQRQEEDYIDGFSYASSLARFASNLGPAGRQAAEARIAQALPPGTQLGLWLTPPPPAPAPKESSSAMATPISPRTAAEDARVAAINGFTAAQLRRYIQFPDTMPPPPGFH